MSLSTAIQVASDMIEPGPVCQEAVVEFQRFDVLGVPISVTNLDSASAAVGLWSQEDTGRVICVRDVNSTMATLESDVLLDLHRRAAMVTADGMPLVWLGKRAGYDVERTCGPDLMERVVAESVGSGQRHFFCGGKPGVVEQSELIK